jgi:hypothetical protein
VAHQAVLIGFLDQRFGGHADSVACGQSRRRHVRTPIRWELRSCAPSRQSRRKDASLDSRSQ